ncbi:MAG: response regulator, partial [Myxococcota bacterium]|nr:response regulator [Myxococcota bacterium]
MAESVSKHILIVDDEKSILHILRNIFIDTPHRLSLVETGQEAKTILEDDGCDLLLTDKNLPDISGLELLRIAKQIDPTVEVIIITGYDSTETVIEALEHDVYAYLLKSEAMDNIYAVRNKVDNALAKQQV